MVCNLCRGQLIKLGTLGNVTYYRCRNCGFETSSNVKHRRV